MLGDGLEGSSKSAAEYAADIEAVGRLLKMPDLMWALLFWRDIEGKAAVQRWVNKQREDSQKLIIILKSLISQTTIGGHRGIQFVYSIPQSNLKEFFDPIEELEPTLLSFDKDKLSRWERLAVEETLKRIENKKME